MGADPIENLRVFYKFVKKVDTALHGSVEIIGDVMVVPGVFVQFNIFPGGQHLVKKRFRKL